GLLNCVFMWASFRVLTLSPLSVKSMQRYSDSVSATSTCFHRAAFAVFVRVAASGGDGRLFGNTRRNSHHRNVPNRHTYARASFRALGGSAQMGGGTARY